MFKKYAIIRANKELEDISFRNPFIRYFPNKMIRKYIMKKFPLDISEVKYLDNVGLDIKLPIIEKEIEDEWYIRKIIQLFNSRMLIYNINTIIVSKELGNFKHEFESLIADEKAIQFLYIDKVIEKITNCINKELKDMNFVIIDGDNSKTRYIIDQIYHGINSLTIVTSKPQIFEDRVEEIFNETGLAIAITNNSINQDISSDIVINCNKEQDKIFYCFEEDSYIIDFISSDDKIKNIIIKRSDINIVTGIDMYVDNRLISKELFHGILLNENRLLRSMYLYGYKTNMCDRLNKIKSKYHLTIGKIYQRSQQL
ncbi:MAG: hypothetical protein N4A63_07535 [Vallitalea sp.]|jgi:hypothetical protein|nr:hypothetical protein [Vallitalea sp.]